MSPSPERPGQNPNVLQSSSLEPNKGSATFARTTYPPETLPRTPTPDGIPVETSRRPETNQNKQKKALRQKIALILGSAAIAAAGVGLAITYREQLGLSSPGTTTPAVEKAEQDIAKKFPIKLEQSSFTPVTAEEEVNLWKNTKTVDLENHTFTIGFPVDQATIDKSPNLRMNSYFEPSLYAGVNVSELEKQGIKNVTQLSGLPKDAPIGFNYDSTKFDASIIAIGIAGVTQGEGSNSFTPIYTNYLIIQKSKQNGEEFQSIFRALYGKPLVAPAPYPKDHSPVYEDGTPIKPDMPILQLTTDLQDGVGQGRLLPGEGGQVILSSIAKKGIDPKTRTIISLSPVFLQTPDGTVASR